MRAVDAAIVSAPDKERRGLLLGVEAADVAVEVGDEVFVQLDAPLCGKTHQPPVEKRGGHACRDADPLLHAALVREVDVLAVWKLAPRREDDRHLVTVGVSEVRLEHVHHCPATRPHDLANLLRIAGADDARDPEALHQGAPTATVQAQRSPFGAMQHERLLSLSDESAEGLHRAPRHHRRKFVKAFSDALDVRRLTRPQHFKHHFGGLGQSHSAAVGNPIRVSRGPKVRE
mmetsp:Transcript_111466/g.314742  ORF Transcript_111466/g.314742 Transcript_111466/m.314742 type:complete len:231 (+) Transcript_111466:445-1137(+)